MTTPEPLGVDGPSLAGFGNELIASAGEIPLAPAPFTVAGGDAISMKITSLLPSIEGPIQTGLPELKMTAAETAGKIVAAAAKYDQTDEQLARAIEALLASEGGAPGGPGGGAPGGAGAPGGVPGSAGAPGTGSGA